MRPSPLSTAEPTIHRLDERAGGAGADGLVAMPGSGIGPGRRIVPCGAFSCSHVGRCKLVPPDRSAVMTDRRTPIGFVGFGEAGFHLARGLRGAGAPPLVAFDINANRG